MAIEERANSVTASEMEEQELLGVITDRGPKMPVLTLNEPAPPTQSIFSKYFSGCAAMFRNKCCLWLMLGGCCRFWQGYTLTYYSFSFFNLYHNDRLYGWLNALAVLVGGFTSSILAGIICDKFEPVNYRTKSYVIVTQSLLAVPICAMAFLSTGSFAVSMIFLFLEYLLAEGWMPAVLSMLLTCIEVQFKGVAVGIFLFATTIAGTVAVWFDARMIKALEATDDPVQIGKMIALSTTVPCLLAAICFWRAGIYYAAVKTEQTKIVEAAIDKVSAYHVDMRTNSISSLLKMNLKGLKPDSYREGDSEYSRYLKPGSQSFFEKRGNITMKERKLNANFNSSIG